MSSKITENAQENRRNMTKEERRLWYDFLKKLDVNVNRQKVVGNYILDFYISQCKIAIELDGSQHYKEENREYDKERDRFLNKNGIKVIRYTNIDVNKNFMGVCADILKNIEMYSCK